MNKLIRKIKLCLYDHLINTYTKKIISYNRKRALIIDNRKILIDSLEYNYDLGSERRKFENNTANALARIDNELYCVNETLTNIFDKKDSYESRRRTLKQTPAK